MGSAGVAIPVFLVGAILFGVGLWGVYNTEIAEVSVTDRFFTTFTATFRTMTASASAVPATTTADGASADAHYNHEALNTTSLKFTLRCTDLHQAAGGEQFRATMSVLVKGPDNRTAEEQITCSPTGATATVSFSGASVPETQDTRAASENDARSNLERDLRNATLVGEYHFEVRVARPSALGGLAPGSVRWEVESEATTYALDEMRAQVPDLR